MAEETKVMVEEEQTDTSTQGQGQIRLIPDWKLHPNVECRVNLERMGNSSQILPSMESQVRRRKFSVPQMDKRRDESNPTNQQPNDFVNVEHVEEFIPDPHQTHIPSVVDEIDIKYEENGIVNTSTSKAEGDHDTDPGDHSLFSNMNPKSGTQCPINSEQIELSEFCLGLLQGEQDCETCQKYIRELCEHIRATHTAGPSPRDPLHIDPLDMGQSSAIEIKCEVDEVIERMDSSEESEADNDFNMESANESVEPAVANCRESDPDYNATHFLPQRKSGQKLGKEHRRSKPRKGEGEIVSQTEIPNSEKPFECEECGKSFTRKDRLTTHMMNHTEDKPYKCEWCPKGFGRRDSLTVHMRIHTRDKPYKCAHCAKSFSQKAHLDYHVRTHTRVKLHNCKTRQNQGKEHRRRKPRKDEDGMVSQNNREKPFNCEKCEKSFTKKGRLTTHMLNHTEDKPYKCERCPKGFVRRDTLTVHMRTHTREKPYKCAQCAKSFSQKAHLDYHVRTHTGEKPFKCALCLMAFIAKNSLTIHMREHVQV